MLLLFSRGLKQIEVQDRPSVGLFVSFLLGRGDAHNGSLPFGVPEQRDALNRHPCGPESEHVVLV